MNRYYRAVAIGLLLGLFSVAFIRTAWVAEDAYISFRVLDNWLSGAGLVWNPGERVQVFTHPLWLFLLAPVTWVLHDPFWACLWLSYPLLLFVVYLLFKAGEVRPGGASAVLLLLLSSRSFIDYSSSGLENPLTHALFVSFLWVYWRWEKRPNQMMVLGVIFALLYLTRPDAVVIVIPAMLAIVIGHIRSGRGVYWPLTPGAALIAAWSAFAFFYFGSVVPNTALAKLGTGQSFAHSAQQALGGILWLARMDTLTLTIIAVGIGWALCSRHSAARILGLGMALWLLYYLSIGGDYMGGRFFSPVVLVASWILIDRLQTARFRIAHIWCAVLAVMLVVGLRPYHGFAPVLTEDEVVSEEVSGGLAATLLAPSDFHDFRIDKSGMADERGFYYRYLGLVPNLFEPGLRDKSPAALLGQQAQGVASTFLACNVGVFGYYARQTIYIIDPLALADPFLSRLPSRDGARVGHYERALPKGYVESQLSGGNQLNDPSLAKLWNLVVDVTRGDLYSAKRMLAIYELNFHGRDLMRAAAYDRNDLNLPGSEARGRTSFSCLGQEVGPYIWPIHQTQTGEAVVRLSKP